MPALLLTLRSVASAEATAQIRDMEGIGLALGALFGGDKGRVAYAESVAHLRARENS